jgi:CubicO group peptidase (beta-lactamase class C family)
LFRITKYDAGLARYQPVDLDVVRRRVARAEHDAISGEIARRSVTVLVNRDSLLPLVDVDPRVFLIALGDSDNPSEGRFFKRRLEEVLPHARVDFALLDRRSHRDEFVEAASRARRYDVVIAASFVRVRTGTGEIAIPKPQSELLTRLSAGPVPLVVLSLGNPYIIMGLEDIDAYLTTYGAGWAAQRAAAEALAGQIQVSGHLPVSIPGRFNQGFGISLAQQMIRWGHPLDAGMDAGVKVRVDSLMEASIADGAFPGGAVGIGRRGVGVIVEGFGYYTYDSEEPVSTTSLFDLASLTKVVATTPAVMMLYDRGQLDLDAPVASYLPEFAQSGKESVTIRQLLTHTGGLVAFHPFYRDGITNRQGVIDFIMADSLRYEPGTAYRYSDLGMITLGLVVEQVSGQRLGAFLRENLWEPLGMLHTGFRPAGGDGTDVTVVPTEVDSVFRMRLMQGEVHDEAAWTLGGMAGHAGLFSTARDLSRYAYMILNGGTANGLRFMREETVTLFTTRVENELGHTRALGWDTKEQDGYSSAGSLFGARSFGHTGFTGTSMWIDPDSGLFVILLTNRVHPTRDNAKIRDVRPALADIVAGALTGE